VKINVVLTDINKDDWTGLAELARNRSIYVRFIELMPIGKGREISGVSNIELLKLMEQKYGKMDKFQGKARAGTVNENIGSGPAVYYQIPGFEGCIGFISAIHGKFCDSCNRIRLTSSGILKPCLCYDSSIDLHGMYMNKAGKNELENALKSAIMEKPKAHCFEDPDMITERRNMIGIGG
ncbi:MAG: GTP 3',8-cyclase MoaA, partial [Lachnospiraceae bacterium]|nr:GTP 3',8-cyclase MoaA [Lachnospiraceae bacterium]